jgi:hypothetical protein
MSFMKKFLWGALALAEAVIAVPLAYPAVLNALIIARTRSAVLVPNRYYFLGMLFGDALRIVPALLLIWHAIVIARRHMFGSATNLTRTKQPSTVHPLPPQML